MTTELLSDFVARVIVAHEAIVDGDAEYAGEVLRDLEPDLTAHVPAAVHSRCPGCAQTFQWPGLLQAHRDVTGCGDKEAVPLAA